MPVYTTIGTVVSLGPGYPAFTLFDGTETPVQGLASKPFARATKGSDDVGSSFLALGMPSDMVIDVQAANENLDASYITTQSITSDTDGKGGATEPGRSQFYRLKISVYTTGAMPVVTVSR